MQQLGKPEIASTTDMDTASSSYLFLIRVARNQLSMKLRWMCHCICALCCWSRARGVRYCALPACVVISFLSLLRSLSRSLSLCLLSASPRLFL